MKLLNVTHTRNVWLPPQTWKPGSPLFNWNNIDLFVVHWPGHDNVPDGDPGEHADDIPGHLRNEQRFYRDVRGYNIGYNVLVDFLGGSWEGRGDDYQCAANAGLNTRAFAVQMMTDLDGRYTDLMVNEVARLYRDAKSIRPHLRMIGHGQGPSIVQGATPTACPGPLQLLVNSGALATGIGGGTPPTKPPATGTGTITVLAGEGFFAVARRAGVTAGALLEANGMVLTDVIHPGQVLKLPGMAAVTPDWWTLGGTFNTPRTPMRYGDIGDQVVQLQAILAVTEKLPGDGGGRLFNPNWVGVDRNFEDVQVGKFYGNATYAAVHYWQSKNGLVADGFFGAQTIERMVRVRGK